MPNKKIKPENQITHLVELEEVFKDDFDLLLFYLTWLKNGLNASKAYRELHPDITEHSSRVLGSRQLAKVSKDLILQAYGLDINKYMQQLAAGLEAYKVNEFDGTTMPDHTARKPYHDKLGKILGIEKDKALIEFNQQVNNFVGWDQFVEMMKKRKEEKNKTEDEIFLNETGAKMNGVAEIVIDKS